MGSEASLGAIVRAKGGDLLEKFPVNTAQRKVMRAMADCRSAALGGHRDSCDSCGFEHNFWNSCRDRHCPGCGGEAREQWLDARRDEVLDVPYFHVVFTIPAILNVLALYAPEVVYAILLRCAGQALLDLGASRLGARMGILAVLHTWGQTLSFHPHVHCVVPEGLSIGHDLGRKHAPLHGPLVGSPARSDDGVARSRFSDRCFAAPPEEMRFVISNAPEKE